METVDECRSKMSATLEKLKEELSLIRAGRANPAILDRIVVDYYGTPTPLKQVANVSVKEARTLEIKPWDKGALREIEKAIQTSDINLTPTNDGNAIRLQFPELNEQRRQELVKEAKKVCENFKVNVRNISRDVLEVVKKDKDLSEDEVKGLEKQVQDVTDTHINLIDKELEAKSKDIMTI